MIGKSSVRCARAPSSSSRKTLDLHGADVEHVHQSRRALVQIDQQELSGLGRDKGVDALAIAFWAGIGVGIGADVVRSPH